MITLSSDPVEKERFRLYPSRTPQRTHSTIQNDTLCTETFRNLLWQCTLSDAAENCIMARHLHHQIIRRTSLDGGPPRMYVARASITLLPLCSVFIPCGFGLRRRDDGGQQIKFQNIVSWRVLNTNTCVCAPRLLSHCHEWHAFS